MTYGNSTTKNLTKYFCIKCESEPDPQSSSVRNKVCKKCKYSITNKGTCEPYSTVEQYEKTYQNVGGVPGCEGAYFDSQTKASHCFMCSEGFALKQTDNGYLCVDSKINRCIVSDLINGRESCYVCRNAVPTNNFLKCDEKAKSDLDENCEFGMRHPLYNNASSFCAMCGLNYALVPKKQANGVDKWECEATVVGNERNEGKRCPRGCAKCNDKYECLWCAHYHGYYMIDVGQCAYFSGIAAFSMLAAVALILVSV